MAKCPFATFDEITGAVGPYSGGPFKIVHHTTEGSTYAGARAAYKAHRSEPHFSVAGDQIFQHVDTGLAARSLKNPPGGVETNRDSAVQIEVVGFAGSAKDVTTLRSVAKLCRWIENEHGVPQKWPNGKLRVSTNGRDPGGHNRSAANWDAETGHYGHSQVPENDHWDPAYSAAELAIVTPDAVFDPHDELEAVAPMIAGRESELAAALWRWTSSWRAFSPVWPRSERRRLADRRRESPSTSPLPAPRSTWCSRRLMREVKDRLLSRRCGTSARNGRHHQKERPAADRNARAARA